MKRFLLTITLIACAFIVTDSCALPFDDYGFSPKKTMAIKKFVFKDKVGHDISVVLLLNSDITKHKNVDAIVNPANETLIGSAGISAALQEAAGPELVEYIENHCTKDRSGNRCAIGEVKRTPA